MTIRQITTITLLFTFLVLCFGSFAPVLGTVSEKAGNQTVTVLCYMNGDNDLSEEVFYSLDLIETAGSSDNVNVIALVDGNPEWMGQYDISWADTRMLKVEFDAQIGVINATVLEDWEEANLADPKTLEQFVSAAIDRYPADRYILYTFAHSQGIIDTRTFSIKQQVKNLSISNDDTSKQKMDLKQFHDAIKRGLDGRQFDLIVLFSCLTNMVEIGYAFSDITHYFIASQDEIRLLNEPSGSFQIRGLQFETAIESLIEDPHINATELGRMLVDSHVDSYIHKVAVNSDSSKPAGNQLSAGMALVACKALPILAQNLDELARSMIAHADDPSVLYAMRDALNRTPRFPSFLNLEYYDLHLFVQNLRNNLQQVETIRACNAVLHRLADQIVIYERHTLDYGGKGMSIYLSNPLVPDNIYDAHQFMYSRSRFSQDTQWDEMIACFRHRLK
ncbi:clostripain-related cysteine peptidase [Desulfosarcina variabilis]|uniref:clostripain-related cysteine peptidase n=1 Tax=Desulfosarcina variabilis TaxID=2300 RepID=UPI003AFAE7E7